MANVIIIENGLAGISTALYTTRAGINTMIIGKDHGASKAVYEGVKTGTEIINYLRNNSMRMSA